MRRKVIDRFIDLHAQPLAGVLVAPSHVQRAVVEATAAANLAWHLYIRQKAPPTVATALAFPNGAAPVARVKQKPYRRPSSNPPHHPPVNQLTPFLHKTHH